MAEPSIVFDAVWKKFRRGERHDSLRDLIPAMVKRLLRPAPRDQLEVEEFWALEDVSFEVRRGDALGIIGSNGAGKSTTLKLLSRILKPTRGRSEVRGRAGALIEVAAGFHPDLTGRENTYLQGAIMGMRQREIAQKFDQIVEFAGVRDFIDTQVKRYSSGMQARLGFAVAAHLDPDVLIIDEVLSVGDVAFQERCIQHMKGLRERGTPIVFVSHNLPAVMDLCDRILVLDRGKAIFEGEPAAAVQAYRSMLREQTDEPGPGDATKPVRITRVQLLDGDGKPKDLFRTGDTLIVRIRYDAPGRVAQAHVAVDIHEIGGLYCYGVSNGIDGNQLEPFEGRGAVDLIVPRLWLLGGTYSISVSVGDAADPLNRDLRLKTYPFSVSSSGRDLGRFYLEHDWRHSSADELDGERISEDLRGTN